MRTRLWILMTVGLVLCGCPGFLGPVCTANFAYGVNATVTDAVTGEPVADATLILSAGSYQETMQAFPDGDFVGAGERAGTYTLTASAPGYQDLTIDSIVVTADECHVRGVHVDVPLQPAP